MPWNPDSAIGNNISYSEANTLANCEWKWDYVYRLGNRGGGSTAMAKGTVTHDMIAAWWETGEIDMEIMLGSFAQMDEAERPSPNERAAIADWIRWIMPRYAAHYGSLRDDMEVVAHELELTAMLPGTAVTVMGHVDGLYRHKATGKLYAVERKTYGRRDRLEHLSVDPQVSLYYWLLKANGYDIAGVMWDGIYTYKWKPEKPTQKYLIEEAQKDVAKHGRTQSTKAEWANWARDVLEDHPGIERPVADSFDLFWLDRTEAQVTQALLDLKGIVDRRTTLREEGTRPIRNIGNACGWCSARSACHEALAFPQSIQLDLSE